MAKPYIHAKSSAKRFGGKLEDYLPVHDFLDSSKAFVADSRHRALLHSTFGIFLCEKVFGHIIKNSDGKEVSVRDIAEQHILEDFHFKFIPTPQDYLENMELQPWMVNAISGEPNSAKKAKFSLKGKTLTLKSSEVTIVH